MSEEGMYGAARAAQRPAPLMLPPATRVRANLPISASASRTKSRPAGPEGSRGLSF